MDFFKIKDLYPDAELTDQPFLERDTFRLPYKNKWIHIPNETINEKEQALLSLLKEESEPDAFPISNSDWSQFMSGRKEQPPQTTKPVRLIQLYLEKMDQQFDYSIWMDSVLHLFEPVLDVFFITRDTCFVLQDNSAHSLSQDEITGMLKTLEDDFSIRTNAYIGHFWQPDNQLLRVFKEEQTIFQQEVAHMHDRISSLPDVALRYFTHGAVANSTIIKELKKQIEGQSDWKELIFSMWESQGNVSVAAKQLFVHRNTLQYRMDRFNQTTGLSLKNMNDLLLCYLLVL